MRRAEEVGAENVYDFSIGSPSIAPPAAVQETEHLLERMYQGSVSMMVSSLVKKQTLSQEEIDKLYAILREVEEEHD